ncbi:hypothetical protein BC940DRAFT_337253 [Gongronella butleri]|nr:hypothetical protein BC940DRAFT_337253 [Gongronella butleri]
MDFENICQSICQKLIKNEFGDNAKVVVAKIMEKGHATPDDLVLSTRLPRAKVKSALKKLAKHNVCIIDKIGLQQAHEDRLSYSVDINGVLARPFKASAAIAKALFENGRMTLGKLLETEALDVQVCLQMAKGRYLLELAPKEHEQGRNGIYFDNQWHPRTNNFLLNINMFNASIRSMTVAQIVGKLAGLDTSRLIILLIRSPEGMTLEKIKGTWHQMCACGLQLPNGAKSGYFTSNAVDHELKCLISKDFVTVKASTHFQEFVYIANLAQVSVKVRQHCLLTKVDRSFDEQTRRIARVLTNGDAVTLDAIHERTQLPKADIWSRLLAAEKVGLFKPDTASQDAIHGPNDKCVWRICSDKIHAATLEEIYELMMDRASDLVDDDTIRTITYKYGTSLVLRDLQRASFL